MQKLAPQLKPYHFKKGQSGNEGGRPKDSPEIKAIKNLTKSELVSISNLIIRQDFGALVALSKREDATTLQRMLAAVAIRIVRKGDMGALDILLNRLVGKVKDEFVHEGLNAPQIIVTLPDNGFMARAIDVTPPVQIDDGYGF